MDKEIEIKNGKYILDGSWLGMPSFELSTTLPDGKYKNTEMKISDGELYPNFPVGCYLIDSKDMPVFPLLPVFLDLSI